MTKAVVESRTREPGLDEIWITFTNVDFYGDNAEYHSRNWHKIEFEKYDKNKDRIEAIEKELLKTPKVKKEKVVKSFFWWKWDVIVEEINPKWEELTSEMNKLKSDRFYTATELLRRAENYLKENGFLPVSKSVSGKLVDTETTIWESV